MTKNTRDKLSAALKATRYALNSLNNSANIGTPKPVKDALVALQEAEKAIDSEIDPAPAPVPAPTAS